MALWLKDLYQDYITEKLPEKVENKNPKPITIGEIRFGSLQSLNENKPNKPLYFLIIDKVDHDLYEVLKVSDWHLFATNSDVLLDLGTTTLIVEVPNNFYLTSEEISKFIPIHQISEEELNEILSFRDGHESELKKGFTPIFEDDIRNKFKKEEFDQIKEFHGRIFEILDDDE